jgi:predicted ester cyclase
VVVHNSGAPDPLSLDGFKQLAGAFLAAFPGGEHTIEDMVSEGDKVVTRVIYRGTHTGDLMGMPPTGKQVAVPAMIVDHITNGKIVETWRLFDQMSMMQQLGVMATPEPATT